MKPLLSVKNVTVRFGGLTAVDDVSFDVRPGELLGLIGPNGAGKTTMMRAIVGVVRPTLGSVFLEDLALNALPIDARIRAGLALSQQLVKPFREMSVQNNVAFAAASRKTRTPATALLHVDARLERQSALDALTQVGIAAYAEQSPKTQPLGILKRLEMARALALKPKLLLLDEPLAGLNSSEAHALAQTIAEVNRQGMTIILIEHNLSEVMRICQRLVVLDNGHKIADALPKEAMSDPAVQMAYLGGDQHAAN
jgi:branched-chain amino acid transport system ATP-binding protein